MIERDLYAPILREYGKKYDLFEEVKLYYRIIDLLCVNKSDRNLWIAMEFKMHNWKKALIQSISYQLVADYSYIVMYEKNIAGIDLDKIKQFGIGLISANTDSFRVVIKSEKNENKNNDLIKKIKERYLLNLI